MVASAVRAAERALALGRISLTCSHEVDHPRAPPAGHVLVDDVDLLVVHGRDLLPSPGRSSTSGHGHAAALAVGQEHQVGVGVDDVLPGELGVVVLPLDSSAMFSRPNSP